jgi:hypothetical protein
MLGQNVAEKLEDAEAGEASGVSRSVWGGGGGKADAEGVCGAGCAQVCHCLRPHTLVA